MNETVMQDRCVNMIARLFHAPLKDEEQAVGTSTVGSSEAIMLAGLAMKRRWQEWRKKEGKPYDKPNMIAGSNVQANSALLLLWFLKDSVPKELLIKPLTGQNLPCPKP
jgi:hypothetical protein